MKESLCLKMPLGIRVFTLIPFLVIAMAGVACIMMAMFKPLAGKSFALAMVVGLLVLCYGAMLCLKILRYAVGKVVLNTASQELVISNMLGRRMSVHQAGSGGSESLIISNNGREYDLVELGWVSREDWVQVSAVFAGVYKV